MPEKHRRPHSHERVQAVEKMRRAWAAERDALTAAIHDKKMISRSFGMFVAFDL